MHQTVFIRIRNPPKIIMITIIIILTIIILLTCYNKEPAGRLTRRSDPVPFGLRTWR